MGKWIFAVRSNCIDEERDDEFVKNYNQYCLPNFISLPDCVRASLFVNPELSSFESGKYIAMYEIETDDIDQTMKEVGENITKWKKEGRFNLLVAPVSFALYKHVNSLTK
jgi:hypothetical protein